MIYLALRNLRLRRGRTGIAAAGICLVVAIAFVLDGVTHGFSREVDRTVDALGTGPLYRPVGASGLISGLVDQSLAPEGTQPMLFARDVDPEGVLDLNIFGFDRPALPLSQGRAVDSPGEVVVDESSGIELGARLLLGGERFDVVGVTTGLRLYAGGPVLFMPIDDVRRVFFDGQPLASAFIGPGTSELPAIVGPVERVDRQLVVDDFNRPVAGAVASLALTRGLLWAMVAGIVFAVGRLALLDRKKELAALRCLGAPATAVASTLLWEGLLVALTGAAAGCGLGLILARFFPLTVETTLRSLVLVVGLSGSIAIVGAALGALEIRRIAPGDAFRGGA